MKKNLFMVAAVAFMALISCNKENINGETESYTPEVAEPSYYVEFTADAANEPAAVPAAFFGTRFKAWIVTRATGP